MTLMERSVLAALGTKNRAFDEYLLKELNRLVDETEDFKRFLREKRYTDDQAVFEAYLRERRGP